MKGLGLVGSGLGVVSMTTPSFHDLDEVIADGQVGQKYPWWIKQRRLEDPTMEIDWSIMQRFDASKCTNGGDQGFLQYVSKEEGAASLARKAERLAQWAKESRPGFSLRDRALRHSNGGVAGVPWTTPVLKSNTYQTLGVPKWEGTPEENSRMLRSALKFFGATMVGYTEFTANIKKLVYTKQYSSPWKEHVFEDVDNEYETSAKIVIPTKFPLWVVTAMSPCALENMKTAPGPLSSRAATGQASNIINYSFNRAQTFLSALGYKCIAGDGNGIAATAGFANLSGLAEAGRRGDAVSPDFGMAMRGQKFLTDLPLVSTPPIDGGIWKFCQSCQKCAEICPSGGISTEPEPTWDNPHPWQAPGKKQYIFDGLSCQALRNEFGDECGLCMVGCVFSKHSEAGVHDFVKAVVANTSLFNSFFKSMDDTFMYGSEFGKTKNPVTGDFNNRAIEWWDLELPTFGFDLGKPM
ncbi:reductive dehalogenase [Dehalogenimonas alkenigignens]|uniref:reductive dehalogenase n=1 Tax=Dehalogenimonas alkenigignens TaxID=1217799 RepID=UPI001403EE74|nr:reductive dehalogenase [Dehalogenimonas alkenigignens]